MWHAYSMYCPQLPPIHEVYKVFFLLYFHAWVLLCELFPWCWKASLQCLHQINNNIIIDDSAKSKVQPLATRDEVDVPVLDGGPQDIIVSCEIVHVVLMHPYYFLGPRIPSMFCWSIVNLINVGEALWFVECVPLSHTIVALNKFSSLSGLTFDLIWYMHTCYRSAFPFN